MYFGALNRYFFMFNKPVTIKDIAKILGFSASTVSRALKDHPDISEETKEKVMRLAEQLNYKPNAIALSLRNRKTNIIGIVIPQIVHHFFSLVISGIEAYARKKGYNVLISQSNENYDIEIRNIQTMISSRVDGILISMTKETIDCGHFVNAGKLDVPIVFFDRKCPVLETDNILINDFEAAYKATEYLIKTGCKNLAHFAGPKSLNISQERLNGFLAAIKKYNLSVNDDFIIRCDSFQKAKDITSYLIKAKNIPDAIFAVNDLTAAGALVALQEAGIKVPDEVSVMGFTNGKISEITSPPLSTIDQNGYKMGYKAAKMLIRRIENKDLEPQTKIIPTELIIRSSTK